ncbi:putative gustatory receptor 59b, partial [Scaptodrosophila lebanonensis]|uniref:Gustatory receptor n=1 Tax=Drosophila lebanonensis TaxID=7225 RepID=A0A6J2ULP3_DROLE
MHFSEKNKDSTRLMWLTTYVLVSVNYATILYSLISRRSRDCELERIGEVITQVWLGILKKQRVYCQHMDRYFGYLFYAKFATVFYLCISNWIHAVIMAMEYKWWILPGLLFYMNALNLIITTTFGYYLALWHIARAFYFVNNELTDLSQRTGVNKPTSKDVEHLRHLRALHAVLTRTSLRINQVYSFQMLASRFDYVVTSIINTYLGLLFTFSFDTPAYLIAFGLSIHVARTLDFYLLDLMCDLVLQYQQWPRHELTECRWFRELNDFVIYASSSKINLWVCGLFQANQKLWFKMMCSITAYSIVLMQFHIY